jgi:hypothetical protein
MKLEYNSLIHDDALIEISFKKGFFEILLLNIQTDGLELLDIFILFNFCELIFCPINSDEHGAKHNVRRRPEQQAGKERSNSDKQRDEMLRKKTLSTVIIAYKTSACGVKPTRLREVFR